jgi:excisionase family DNA binding protein
MLLRDLENARRELGGIGHSTLRRWIRDGRLRAVRLGRRVLIDERELRAFVARAARAATPAARRDAR